MAATIKVPTEFTAIDKITSVTKKMASGVTRFAKTGVAAMKRFDTKVSTTVRNMSKISKVALGLGIGALFTAAIQNNIAYNDSLASVASITGLTGKELANLEQMSLQTAKTQKMLGSEVNKAYELVGSAQPTLLKNTKLLNEVTNAAVTLSKAGKMDLTPSVEALTTTLNQFSLDGTHAKSVIDNLSAGSVAGASNITQTADAIKKFGTNASAAGIKVNESIALIQLASPFEKGAEAGTKLRNILAKMSGAKVLPPEQLKMLKATGVQIDVITNKSTPLKDRLVELSKVAKDSDAMSKIFGADSGLAQGLFDNAAGFEKMLDSVNKTNVAQEQAKINTTTLDFAIKSIKTSFLNATTATNTNNGALKFLIDLLGFVSNNMNILVGILGVAVVAFGTMKTILWATRAGMFAYNVVLGINTALTQNNKRALIGNTIATNAYKVAMAIGTGITWLATAATTAFGIALNLGLWPILAIIAAIVAVVLVIKNWSKITDWFGEKWKQFTGWIGGLWDKVVGFFKDFDFTAFFKNIGQSILSFMLMPMKALLTLLSKLPGKIGELAQLGLDKIGEVTGDVEADINKTEETLPSPEENQQNAIRDAKVTAGGSIGINIKDKGGNVDSTETETTGIPVKVTTTQGAF